MTVEQFGRFDAVKLKSALSTVDIDGFESDLPKGKDGCVLEEGKTASTVVVEFKTGRGSKGTDYTPVEVDVDCLEIVTKIGRRFGEPSSYLEDTLAIKSEKP